MNSHWLNASIAICSTSVAAAEVQICEVPDPADPESAFEVERGDPVVLDNAWMPDYWVRYSCKQTCADYRACTVPTYDFDRQITVNHARNPSRPKPMVAFVADDMGGYLSYSDDGYEDAPLIYLQDGGGGTQWSVLTASRLEKLASVRTIMVRWADGFRFSLDPEFGESEGWGFLTRTDSAASNIQEITRRVADIMTWIHDEMVGEPAFGSMACSMGTNAILGPVLFHGLDEIIDYQSFTGGPFFWDIQRACNLPSSYRHGYCALNGTTSCESNADCGGEANFCQFPGVIGNGENPFANRLYESAVNHMHGTDACRIDDPDPIQYTDFENSSYGLMKGLDWEFDHRVDLFVDLGGAVATYMGQTGFEPGDEFSLLGHFMYVFNRISPAQNRYWHAQQSHHCNSYAFGRAVEVAIDAMGLERRADPNQESP